MIYSLSLWTRDAIVYKQGQELFCVCQKFKGVVEMPTYEYECEKCGHVFEEFQSINAKPIETCKKEGCGGSVRRLFSPGRFLFKGSGFYITDYRSDSYKKVPAVKAQRHQAPHPVLQQAPHLLCRRAQARVL